MSSAFNTPYNINSKQFAQPLRKTIITKYVQNAFEHHKITISQSIADVIRMRFCVYVQVFDNKKTTCHANVHTWHYH